MSDGDNATPGRPGSSGRGESGDDNQWLTRSARPMPGAAPWERSPRAFGPGPVDDEPSDQHLDEPSPSQHTDGVTVADLIAKLSGTRAEPLDEPPRHRADPDPEPEPEAAYEPEPQPPLRVAPPTLPAYS